MAEIEKPLFSFGIITDTHIRPPQGDDSSPFPVNDLANGRARYAAALLSAQAPVFTVHLGDMVHTLPHMDTYTDACLEAHQIFTALKPRLYFVPGNHDIGDKPMPGSPAKGVSAESSHRYHEYFGDAWYSFEHQNAQFLVINSSLINSGSTDEAKQKEWLESTLAKNTNRRLFLFSHYPPYIHDPAEPEHYDNYAEPGRSWLLGLIHQYSPEVVFSGHVHQFFYNCLNHTTLYCLPPTSFIRQDYAELFRVEPSAEYGRNDPGKFSVAMVDVYKQHHRLRLLSTDGRGQASTDEVEHRAQSVPTSRNCVVHLRHAWYESIDLPYNGPMEEFSRKRARNDYGLLRLLQMGIRDVRIPVSDLLSARSRQRMQDYSRLGIRFHLFQLGNPDPVEIDTLIEHGTLVSSLECVSPTADFSQLILESLEPLGNVFLSKAHSSAASHTKGRAFAHSVSNGFLADEVSQIINAVNAGDRGEVLKGIVFQVPLEDELQSTLTKMDALFADSRLTGIANIRLAHSNPAVANFDDEGICERVMQALNYADRLSHVNIHFDTFVDIDRGYNPRHGLIDRRYNFRKAGRTLVN